MSGRHLRPPAGLLACCLFLAALLAAAGPAGAQLATSFYNVTGIEKRVLPNAVQITITTDGNVNFGGDLAEWVEFGPDRADPRPVTSFRLRLLGARARLPAFVDIGAYPADAAVVTLGTDELKFPFFRNRFGPSSGERRDPASELRVDIQPRFFVPVTIQRFNLDTEEYSGITFNDGALGPREVSVRLGPDRRTIVITILSDRVDTGGAARIVRSPPEDHKHRLSVTPTTTGPDRFRMDALHAPLADLLGAVSRVAADLPLVAAPDAAAVDVSLLLPDASPAELLRVLAGGYGLTVTPRAPAEGGGFTVARGGAPSTLTRLPLQYLAPERARLLFPDFLLPYLRADAENNALIVSGSPELAARLRSDLARLDLPRPQVRVEVSAYEFADERDARFALRATRTLGRESESLDTGLGQLSVRVQENQRRAFAAAVDALVARGRARLAARPFVVVASGEEGTLFLGQSRYVTVLRSTFGGLEPQALRLPIGTSLTVFPLVGAAGDITLEIRPQLSTVDAIEAGTGLPTLGIRETRSTLRVRPGDAVLVAGLESDLNFDTRSRFLGLEGGARRANRGRTSLILLVTARKA